eukprot:gb/GECH01000826.1/.p1 GENE.gb/GECH01000826.1/~~gb/GECH01000826.1/.p1  ORF type:complete len:827 (+),score=119.64 gb/GECH01000826.1/:1-2481(+)
MSQFPSQWLSFFTTDSNHVSQVKKKDTYQDKSQAAISLLREACISHSIYDVTTNFTSTIFQITTNIVNYENNMTRNNDLYSALHNKQQGNQAFLSRNYRAAITYYTRSLYYSFHDIDHHDNRNISHPEDNKHNEENQQHHVFLSHIFNNRATCHFHMKQWKKAAIDASRAIMLYPSYRKAFYRRGMAFKKLGHINWGRADIEFSKSTDTILLSSPSSSPPSLSSLSSSLKVTTQNPLLSFDTQNEFHDYLGKLESDSLASLSHSKSNFTNYSLEKNINSIDLEDRHSMSPLVSESMEQHILACSNLPLHIESSSEAGRYMCYRPHGSSASSSGEQGRPVDSHAAIAPGTTILKEDCCPINICSALEIPILTLESSITQHQQCLYCLDRIDPCCSVPATLSSATESTYRKRAMNGFYCSNRCLDNFIETYEMSLFLTALFRSQLWYRLSSNARLAAYSLFSLYQSDSDVDNDVYDSNFYNNNDELLLNDLESHLDDQNEIDSELKFRIIITSGLIIQGIEDYTEIPKKEYWMKKLIKRLFQVEYNAVTLTSLTSDDNKTDHSHHEHDDTTWELYQERIGKAIFPAISMINHSCSPNAYLAFEYGRDTNTPMVTASVVATRPICPGEPVTISYGPHAGRHRYEDRQRILREKYLFSCHCCRCSRDRTLNTDNNYNNENNEFNVRVSHFFEKASEMLDHCIQTGNTTTFHQCTQMLLETVSMYQKQYPSSFLNDHLPYGRIHDTLARAYASVVQDFSRAAEHAEVSQSIASRVFGICSPESAAEAHKVAALWFNAGKVKRARRAIENALEIVSNNSDRKELKQMLYYLK